MNLLDAGFCPVITKDTIYYGEPKKPCGRNHHIKYFLVFDEYYNIYRCDWCHSFFSPVKIVKKVVYFETVEVILKDKSESKLLWWYFNSMNEKVTIKQAQAIDKLSYRPMGLIGIEIKFLKFKKCNLIKNLIKMN